MVSGKQVDIRMNFNMNVPRKELVFLVVLIAVAYSEVNVGTRVNVFSLTLFQVGGGFRRGPLKT